MPALIVGGFAFGGVAEVGDQRRDVVFHMLEPMRAEAILNAIRRQDPDAARAAMLLHLSNSLERMTGE